MTTTSLRLSAALVAAVLSACAENRTFSVEAALDNANALLSGDMKTQQENIIKRLEEIANAQKKSDEAKTALALDLATFKTKQDDIERNITELNAAVKELKKSGGVIPPSPEYRDLMERLRSYESGAGNR